MAAASHGHVRFTRTLPWFLAWLLVSLPISVTPSQFYRNASNALQTYDEFSSGDRLGYSLSVFILPPPILGDPTEAQHRLLRALVVLKSVRHIFLVGNHPSHAPLAAAYKRRGVQLETQVDHTFLGTPIFASVFARASSAHSDLALIINADVITLNIPDLQALLRTAFSRFDKFLIIAPRIELPQITPAEPIPKKGRGPTISALSLAIQDEISQYGKVATGGPGLWLWNLSPKHLYQGHMPIFPATRGLTDTWLAQAALKSISTEVIGAGGSAIPISFRKSENEPRGLPVEVAKKTLKERALGASIAYGVGRQLQVSGSGSQWETEDKKCSTKPVWEAANCSTGMGTTSTLLDDVSML